MSIQASNIENLSTSSGSYLTQNIAAVTFGVIVIFAVGFLPMSAAHNAAHDTRHSFAFPCH